MNEYIARTLNQYTEDQIWTWCESMEPNTTFRLEFDDVIITTKPRDTLLSWYYWWLHRQYPDTSLLAVHHISVLGHYHGNASPDILTRITESIRNTYDTDNSFDYDKLAREVYQVQNMIYNMVDQRLGAYVTTVDARDYTDVLYHPEIMEVRQKCIDAGGTPKSLNELFDVIPKILSREDFLLGNGIVEATRSKNASIKQILQCIGMIGFRTDIDSRIFPKPVLECFGTGLRNFNDFLIETRSASKALLFQKDPIRDTEYFNRRLQIVNNTVRYLIPGDCGTTQTLNWPVQPGDLSHMDGKYYYDDNNVLQVIKPKSKQSLDLVGKTIRLRSPLMCNHTAIYGVCQTCIGAVAKTIPKGSNIGHVTAYTMCEKITQSVLSVKHLDGVTEIKGIELDKSDLRYVRLSTQKAEYIKMQRRWMKQKTLKILLPISEVENLTQAMQTDALTNLNIYKISQLYKVGFKYETEDEEIVDWVTVSGPSRPSSLTIPFLEHIKKVKYFQEDAKYLEIPLDGWDYELPMLQLPQKQINMLDFMNKLSNMLECGPKNDIKKGLDPSRPDDLVSYIRAILDFSSQHINIPLYCIEVTTLALLIRSTEDNDYRVPANDGNRQFASNASIIRHRSLSAALAYEEQAKMVTSASSFDPYHRAPHPMDALFMTNYDPSIFDDWYDTPDVP